MPSVLLSDTISIGTDKSEPWPDDVQLFQPFITEQILLPEISTVTSVQAFLRMCSLPFTTEQRANAEQMSPSGAVPFIRCGTFVVAEMDSIVAFVNSRGIHLSDHLDAAQKADMRAYMSLVNSVLYSAELYLTWINDEIYNVMTYPRYAFAMPWPLDWILCWKKRRNVTAKLDSISWADRSLEELYTEVNDCCQALADRLGTQLYFFGEKKTELDALVYGHVSAILMTPLPDNKLREIITEYPTLIEHCRRIDNEYFHSFN